MYVRLEDVSNVNLIMNVQEYQVLQDVKVEIVLNVLKILIAQIQLNHIVTPINAQNALKINIALIFPEKIDVMSKMEFVKNVQPMHNVPQINHTVTKAPVENAIKMTNAHYQPLLNAAQHHMFVKNAASIPIAHIFPIISTLANPLHNFA